MTIYLIAAAISAVLYKIGGCGKEEISFANSQFRDIGCPIVVLTVLLLSGLTWYLCILAALLVLGFIRTYWDFLFKNHDNLYLHGLFLGLSMTPLYWSGIHWFAIGAYSLVLCLVMGVLNTVCTRFKVPFSVWVEELTRGFILIAAMPILWIH